MRLIICILSLWLFSSCGPSAEEKAISGASKIETTQVAKWKYTVKGDGTIEYPDSSCECINWYNETYTVYILNGCEYIKFSSGSSAWGSHSGTCPNSIHKYKPEQIYLPDTIK